MEKATVLFASFFVDAKFDRPIFLTLSEPKCVILQIKSTAYFKPPNFTNNIQCAWDMVLERSHLQKNPD